MVSGALDFIQNNKKLTGGAILVGAGYAAGKNKGRAEQGEILRKNLVNVRS